MSPGVGQKAFQPVRRRQPFLETFQQACAYAAVLKRRIDEEMVHETLRLPDGNEPEDSAVLVCGNDQDLTPGFVLEVGQVKHRGILPDEGAFPGFQENVRKGWVIFLFRTPN